MSGTVSDLHIHNSGELVSAGTAVATILPDGVPLVVHAAIPNKDIGFVQTGLPARIRVDAYPFQQFGTVDGEVRKVFPNAGGEESFRVTLTLLEDSIEVSGNTMPLFPGLTVEAEVLTDKHRLLSVIFFKFKQKVIK